MDWPDGTCQQEYLEILVPVHKDQAIILHCPDIAGSAIRQQNLDSILCFGVIS